MSFVLEKQSSAEKVSSEMALFTGGELGLYNPWRVCMCVQCECTSLPGVKVLIMPHFHECNFMC